MSDNSECNLYDSHMGATYSLIDLKRFSGQLPYIVQGGVVPCDQQTERNYTYFFNICGIINSGIPKVCSDDPALAFGLSTAAVLQVNETPSNISTKSKCHVIGSYSSEISNISLLDQEDPTKGLKITYHGTPCGSSETIKRQVNIELSCADVLNPIPQSALELTTCVYTIKMPSIYGCPLECPVSKRSLCGGAGYCGYDYDVQKARCYCNKGYGGTDCSASSDFNSNTISNESPALLGLIMTLFLLISVLILSIVLLIRQVRASQGDGFTYYQVLKGGDDNKRTSSLNTATSKSFAGRHNQADV